LVHSPACRKLITGMLFLLPPAAFVNALPRTEVRNELSAAQQVTNGQ